MKKLILITILTIFAFNVNAEEVNKTVGDNTKYLICYGEMTELYKANGLHKSNRSFTIEMKERVCSSYSRGEISSYPKQ